MKGISDQPDANWCPRLDVGACWTYCEMIGAVVGRELLLPGLLETSVAQHKVKSSEYLVLTHTVVSNIEVS